MADRRHREMRRYLESEGYAFEGWSGGTHMVFRHTERGDPIYTSSSPSNSNYLNDIKRTVNRAKRTASQQEAARGQDCL